MENIELDTFEKRYNFNITDFIEQKKVEGLTKFIWSDDMTDKEKEDHPEHECLQGYLRKMSYKEAFKYSWDSADKDDRKLILGLPNFDNEIFKEISGIDVLKELKKNCHMGGINESIQ